jgi:probable addiction module antidote protein
MPLETLPFDSAQHLKTQQDIALYLQAVLEENDPALFCHALGQVARAKGMTQLARETGLAREALYRAGNHHEGHESLGHPPLGRTRPGVRLTRELSSRTTSTR